MLSLGPHATSLGQNVAGAEVRSSLGILRREVSKTIGRPLVYTTRAFHISDELYPLFHPYLFVSIAAMEKEPLPPSRCLKKVNVAFHFRDENWPQISARS